MSASFVSIAVHLFIVSIATTHFLPVSPGFVLSLIPTRFEPRAFYTKSFNLSRSVWYALKSSDLVADSLSLSTSPICR